MIVLYILTQQWQMDLSPCPQRGLVKKLQIGNVIIETMSKLVPTPVDAQNLVPRF
jgi:hypothetical protein